jgi:hypothetical protein
MREDRNSKKANGHPDVPNASVETGPEPLIDVVSGVGTDSVLEMHTGLFTHGYNRARQSGTVEQRPEDVAALTEHARAIARRTHSDKFDPSQNAHDAMHQAEYERLFSQRVEAETTEQHAAANLRDAEIALAGTPKAGPKPQVHPWLIAAFTIVITVTVAPTLHDLFATGDDLLAWFFATLSSVLLGFMLTWAILSGRRSPLEWIGVASGVILGVGLGAIRLSATGDAGEKGIAIGLTIVEIATVLLLEWLASGLRRRDNEWLPLHTAETQATAARDAAQTDLLRWKAKLKELNAGIASKIALVEKRHNRNINLPELEAVAIKAVVDGYNAGIAENIGIIRGVRSPLRRTA